MPIVVNVKVGYDGYFDQLITCDSIPVLSKVTNVACTRNLICFLPCHTLGKIFLLQFLGHRNPAVINRCGS